MDDLFFSCRLDEFSEVEVVNELRDINYLVDNLLLNIMAADQSIRSPPKPGFNLAPDIVTVDGLPTLLNHLSAGNARDLVVEVLLRDSIFGLLHANFFDGDIFYAVGSETFCTYLDRIMAELIAGGKLSRFIFRHTS